MTKADHEIFDFVIAGAGPAGLTAAISAASRGFTALILEKGKTAGPLPRGEGIVPHSFLYELLGRDFFDTECYKMDGSLVFHSPGNIHQTRLPGKRTLCFFPWRSLIDRLVSKVLKLGVKIMYNTEVTTPVMNDRDICIGLNFQDEKGKVGRVHGNAVLACDGYKSAIGSFFQVPYDLLNCTMIKCLAEGAAIDINKAPDLRFYLIANGDLPFAPEFPPCVAYAFPIGGSKMELGLMLRMAKAHGLKTMRIPDEKQVLEVWEHLKHDYKGFSDFFKGARIVHEEVTGMSNVGMVDNIVPAPGVVLIGDSAGFIDPFGSSGLYSGMMMADFWVDSLVEKMIIRSGKDGKPKGIWEARSIRSIKKSFERTAVFRQVKRSYTKTGIFEWFIFRHLRNSKNINKRWALISLLLKLS